MTQWLRRITVQYGQELASPYGPEQPWELTSEGNDDYRIQFRFSRTNTNRADSGRVMIYNLPPEFASSIKRGTKEANEDRARILVDPRWRNDIEARNNELRELAQANLVKVYAGYRDSTKLIFTGDITELSTKSMGSTTDSITSIDLGDTIIPLKYGWLTKSFGGGARLDSVLSSVLSVAGIPASEQAKKFLETTVPGVEVAEFRNGYIVQGGINVNIDALVARYGVQWFVRDGETYFMPRGSLLDDFAIRLDLGENVLRPVSDLENDSVSFTMLLDGEMLPGRGFRIFDEQGQQTSNFGYRADTVDYVGDTHGNPWYCMVQGSRIEDVNFPPSFAALQPSEVFTLESVAVP